MNATHWHAEVQVPGKALDRSPAMTWDRAKRFKADCEARWTRPGASAASRRCTLIVSGPTGRAVVLLKPCTDDRCLR